MGWLSTGSMLAGAAMVAMSVGKAFFGGVTPILPDGMMLGAGISAIMAGVGLSFLEK
ncbi:MAG: hypothetical protein AB1468_03725 [Candidatus Micrarchaeota archaeon]